MRIPPLGLLAVLPLLAACGSANLVDIEGRDSSASAAHLRLTFPVGAPSEPGLGALGMIDAGRVTGSDTQSLAPGELIDFAGTQWTGPADIDSECRLTWIGFDVLYRDEVPAGGAGRFRLEAGCGLEATRVDLRLSGAGADDRDASTFWGLRARARGELRLLPWFGPYAELGGTWSLGPAMSKLVFSRAEAGLVIRAWPREPSACLFGGWTRTHLQETLDGSDLEYELRGFVVGLDLGF